MLGFRWCNISPTFLFVSTCPASSWKIRRHAHSRPSLRSSARVMFPLLHPKRAQKMAHIQKLMDATGLSEATIRQKVNKGMTDEEILSPGYRKGLVKIGDQERTVREWSEYTKQLYGDDYIPYKTILYRMSRGWTGEELIAPLGHQKARPNRGMPPAVAASLGAIPDLVKALIREERKEGASKETVANRFMVPADLVDVIAKSAPPLTIEQVAGKGA